MGTISSRSPAGKAFAGAPLNLSLVTGNWKLEIQNMVTFGMSFGKSPVTSDKLPVTSGFMGSLHALSSTHWDHEPERGRSPAAARRQLGGIRKTRTPWSWRERCARGPGALRVQRFME